MSVQRNSWDEDGPTDITYNDTSALSSLCGASGPDPTVGLVAPRPGHKPRMSNPALPGPSLSTSGLSTSGLGSPPPMPSILASAALETLLLLGLTRRTVATWLTRG